MGPGSLSALQFPFFLELVVAHALYLTRHAALYKMRLLTLTLTHTHCITPSQMGCFPFLSFAVSVRNDMTSSWPLNSDKGAREKPANILPASFGRFEKLTEQNTKTLVNSHHSFKAVHKISTATYRQHGRFYEHSSAILYPLPHNSTWPHPPTVTSKRRRRLETTTHLGLAAWE